MAIENGTLSYMPPKNLRQFEMDIAPLMGFGGTSNDFLLSPLKPYEHFLHFWQQAGKTFPNYIHPNALSNTNTPELSHIVPWGWSFVAANRFKHFISKLDSDCYIPAAFNEEFKYFFSRKTSVLLSHELFNRKDQLPSIAELPFKPQIIEHFDAASALYQSNPSGILFKTLWSSSGRGLCTVRDEQQLRQATSWIKARIKQHGYIIAEPLLNKIQDASFQFIILPDGSYEKLGINYFDTDNSGHFQREYFKIPPQIAPHLPKDNQWIDEISDILVSTMKALNIHLNYQGPVGIDVLFYQDESGDIKLMPFIEANLRYNMGLINLHIKKHIHPHSEGEWQITLFQPGEWNQFYQYNTKNHQAVYKDGLLYQGFMPLTPCHENARFAAWGHVKPIY